MYSQVYNLRMGLSYPMPQTPMFVVSQNDLSATPANSKSLFSVKANLVTSDSKAYSL